MPAVTTTRLPGSEIKIALKIEQSECTAYFEEGVKTLSMQRPVPGFRPGHLPMADAKRLFGDMAILEASLERIVRAFYVKALLSEGIASVGSPSINIDKLTPDEPIEFHAIVPVEPAVVKAADPKDCNIDQKAINTTDEQVNEGIEQLRKMRHIEVPVERAAEKTDILTVDIEMKKDNVIIEGGTGNDYKVYLSEPHYLPSFTEQLLGLKAGDEKTIEITFPADHYQKHIAGQPVNVSVKAKAVHEMTLPPLDDAFAVSLGLKDVEDLKTKLRENLTLEAEQKSAESAEIQLLEKLIDSSDIEQPPEILVNEEIRRMLTEMQQGIEEQGGKWDEYLTTIKKTVDQLRLDFVPQVIRRIKTAVLIKHFSKQENIDVPAEDVDAEIDRILNSLRSDDKAAREHISSADYREYVYTMMKNRKTIAWLKDQCIKKTNA
jgi:trigger factor